MSARCWAWRPNPISGRERHGPAPFDGCYQLAGPAKELLVRRVLEAFDLQPWQIGAESLVPWRPGDTTSPAAKRLARAYGRRLRARRRRGRR